MACFLANEKMGCVFESPQQVAASLSIAGPRDRMLEKDGADLVAHLKSAAESIQRYL